MLLLILGLALWIGAHLCKRLAPGLRESLGPASKGVIAVLILVGLALMVIGYRGAEGAVFWGRSPGLVGINNLHVGAMARTWSMVRQRPNVKAEVPEVPPAGGAAVWVFALPR